jgi:hypothetical protein
MPHIITHNIASLPLYQDGFAAGQDTGLRLALDQLTQERLRQERLLARLWPGSIKATRIAYCDGVLLSVSKAIAARFRGEVGTYPQEETR